MKVRVTFTREAHPAMMEVCEPEPLATVEHDVQTFHVDGDGDLILYTQPGNTIVFSADEWHALTALKVA